MSWLRQWQVWFWLGIGIGTVTGQGTSPSLRDNVRQPLHVHEGEDALLTCVVRNLGGNTLMWLKNGDGKTTKRILTAGENRVDSDKRFSVMHDSAPTPPIGATHGGDVWVLVIKGAKVSDTGLYVCEVNSNPVLQSFHTLEVIPTVSDSHSASNPTGIEVAHDYSRCCKQSNVSSTCLGFCSLRNILDGTTNVDPEKCESEFPAIVKCMADGRNHVPCCAEEGVPEICQDVCRGEYVIPSDDIQTHHSCSAYTEQTLACIAEGIQLLPSPPQAVQVEPVTETTVKIMWTPPAANAETITHYVVNVTSLATFDDVTGYEEDGVPDVPEAIFKLQVSAQENSTMLDNLVPFKMYEVTVTSHNARGNSLPSLRVRFVPRSPASVPVANAPALPDIRSCCVNKGIYHTSCLDKFCDPIKSASANLPDLMICAPWAKDSFSCLANEMDHTACCRSRGLPPPCIQLCSGNVTRIDFNHFRCIQYMGDLSNCMLKGYGVLPSAPVFVRVNNINANFAIVRWEPPKTLAKTVSGYRLRYRLADESKNHDYHSVDIGQNTYILENLYPATEYEVYVSAVNSHGVGDFSNRVLFKTTKDSVSEFRDAVGQIYNMTQCCEDVGLSSHCMPLCGYGVKLSDLRSLVTVCGKEFPKLLRCGTGGRNHLPCCERRGIPDTCHPLCTGAVAEEVLTTAAACIPYLGSVMQCFEEGTGLLPAPITQLHATVITNSSITLVWQAPLESQIDSYVVYYQETEQNSSPRATLTMKNSFNTTEPLAVIPNLKTNTAYSFFVLAINEYGTSLPSSVLTVNISDSALENGAASGVPSAPQELTVSSRSADYITITWQHPVIMHPTDRLLYKVYYRSQNASNFSVVQTSATSYRLSNLTANTQHILYVTVQNDHGESRPSETLLAWTDPAYAAIVEVPTIHPISIVLEGGSMTVLCVAMGTPMPTVSLYISGQLIHQERTRHMVTVISNVTRYMNDVTCHADNNVGSPSQTSRRVVIGRRPRVVAPLVTMVSLNTDGILECEIDAHPKPEMYFSRDMEGQEKLTNDSQYSIQILRDTDKHVDATYILQLKLKNVEARDAGNYYCNAKNTFGSFSQTAKIQIREKQPARSMNVAQCCAEQNVTSACMDACSVFLDIEAVIDRPECIGDFQKLMRCAADGSDHRSCCSQWGVPRRCLDWCRGEAVPNAELCILSYTKQIVSCFYEGRDSIPGPPQNVRVEVIQDNVAQVSWDPPVKNPQTVELYRVIWQQVGSLQTEKNDTKATSLQVFGLREGTSYEFVIKAGNRRGTSTLTAPIQFTMNDKSIMASTTGGSNPHLGVAVGVVLALVFITAAVVAAFCYLRKKKITGVKMSGGVSFDNPSFLRRTQAADTIQIISSEVQPEIEANQSNGWKQEALQAAPQAETNPNVYEELRLGSEGAGFKRLK